VLKRGPWAVCFLLVALSATASLLLVSRAGRPAFLRPADSTPAALYGSSRLFYPRLSLHQAYQPCCPEAEPGLVPGYDCLPSPATQNLLRRRLLAAEHSQRGPATATDEQQTGSRWLLQLAAAKKGQFATVARGLEAEARKAANEGPWIDTSAAFYLAATVDDLPGLLSRALAATDRALEIAPRSPAAVFNRALILEALALRGEARTAWRYFLLLEEDGSPWRTEAEQHLTALSAPSTAERWQAAKREIDSGQPLQEARTQELAASFASPLRDGIELQLLPAWATSWLQRQDLEEARRLLDITATLARALENETHEALPSAEIQDLYEALQGKSATALTALAHAVLSLRDARASYVKGNYPSTLDSLATLERTLGASRPSLRLWARYYRAASLDQQGFKPAADELLVSLVADLEGLPFPSLRARAQALRGRIKNNLGRPDEAIPLLTSAIETLDAVKDSETGTWAHTLLGDSYRLLGDIDSCWRQYYIALHQIETLGTPLRELAALNAMADFLLSTGDDRLALHYEDAAVPLGPRLDNPSFFADVLLWRSLLRSRLNDRRGALADLQQAQNETAKVRDPLRRERFRADFSLYLGAGLLDRDPEAAVGALGTALSYFGKTEQWSRVLLSLEARALAYGRLADRKAELRDLSQARALYVQVGRQLKQDAVRISFAGRIENAFDQTLRLDLETAENAETTLAQVEQERALNHPLLQEGSWLTEPASLSAIRSALPPGSALVEYAVLSDRLLVWLVLNGKVSLYQSAVPKAELSAKLESFLAADWSGARWRAGSSALGNLLLGAVQTELARSGVTSLVLVPDDELFGLPFAALTLPGSGRLLIEDYALAVSPSASLLAHRHAEASRLPESFRIIAVANPEIDRSVWPNLPDLRAASSEGTAIQRLFLGRSELLEGGQATAAELQHRLAQASWLHFAGHAIPVPRRPLDSYLLLSPATEHSGRLTAAELVTWDLSHLQGAVLSACSSAASVKESWPGAVTLARPFLAAGVPTVIGSLWDVRDQDSAAFFEVFYRRLASHGSAFRAFHEAQLASWAGSRGKGLRKTGWIAFQLFGGPDVPVQKGE